ncbi:glycoside hydrolase family 32 protein [Apiospora arundinis]|uniref:Glycoside hydrolase family 32 protein n=1 Tax=Apiospora arundinis TaxID=335852 RepID=A0ABR2IAK5_9PEZI
MSPTTKTVDDEAKTDIVDQEYQNQKADDVFSRWRPKYHLLAPKGWVNDPCAPGYDPVHQTYHVGFQWVPDGVEWNNSISWGSAVSPDFVTWTVREKPSLAPTPEADVLGVFTGCMSPVSAKSGAVTAFYTSVTRSPIHHALPYCHGQELLHAATSSDAGKTWIRYENNPVLSGPPAGFEATGWRDPFIAPWVSMARLLDDPPATSYALIAGGTKNGGPTSFLYSISPESLYEWTFVSTLGTMPKSSFASGDRYDYGSNWEVTNFISFPNPDSAGANDSQLDFLVMSVEGMTETGVPSGHTEFRRDHKQMWLCGKLAPGQDKRVELAYQYGGFLDHGCYYAGNSFYDPKNHRHVIFGWLVEEDLPLKKRQAQGWSGMLSLPRILKLQRLENVFQPLGSKMESLKSFGVEKTAAQTYVLTTLCAVPDGSLQELRRNHQSLGPRMLQPRTLDGLKLAHGQGCWELDVSFDVAPGTEAIRLILQHSKDDPLMRTIIEYAPSTETLTIVRRYSTFDSEINTSDETAHHTLFQFLDASSSADSSGEHSSSSAAPLAPRQEHLSLRIFFDVSALEVFANERTAISTRVYPPTGACHGISTFVEGDIECKMLEFDYWEMAPSIRTEA